MEMKAILGIGNALTDISVVLPHDGMLEELGLAKGSMRHVAREDGEKIWRKVGGLPAKGVPGGSAANTVAAVAQLGMTGGFLGKVGRDAVGDTYEASLIRAGVRPFLLRGEAPSGKALVFISENDGERTFATYLGAALELNEDELEGGMFDGYSYLHLEGYLMQCRNVVGKAVSMACEKGLTVSFDLGSYNMVNRNLAFLRTMVQQYVHILFANSQEAEAFTGHQGEDAARIMAGMMRPGGIAVVKLGAEGSVVCCNGEVLHIPPYQADAVDTTGAGDIYAAGFLYAHSLGYPLYRCGCAGSYMASVVVANVGPKIEENGWKAVKEGVRRVLDQNN